MPVDLLRAIGRVESGRRRNGAFAPWPWTVNVAGKGRFFDDPEALIAWLQPRRGAGARSFDLGCFQVNHLWHGAAFESLREMLDPDANARYAARFLRGLYEETGSWEEASGLYHSRTPALTAAYRARVSRQLDALGGSLRSVGTGDAPRGAAARRGGFEPPSRQMGHAEALGFGVPLIALSGSRANAERSRLEHASLARDAFAPGAGLLRGAAPMLRSAQPLLAIRAGSPGPGLLRGGAR